MPNSRRWQQSGARRGWAVHEDLQQEAWLRVLQGRRHLSVKWPHARSQQRGQTGSGVATKLRESSKERQASPSNHNARSARLRPFVDANIKKSEAGDRVQQLQQALNILGDTEGADVDGLRAALKRAETAAQGVPVDMQDLVSHLQAQVRGGDPDMPCGPVAKRPCRSAQGRVPVLAIPAELSAWLEERHADLHDALVNGDNGRVLELTSLLSERAKRLVELTGGMCP